MWSEWPPSLSQAPASSLDIYTVGNASQFPTLRDLGSSIGWTTFTCPPASATTQLRVVFCLTRLAAIGRFLPIANRLCTGHA